MNTSSRRSNTFMAAVLLLFSLQAAATQFPISSGTVIINGSSDSLPAGGTFGDSSYNSSTGYLSAGKFAFQQATITEGGFTVTYQLTQTDTSAALIDSAGNVAFTTASMKLSVTSASFQGIPLSVSPCVFAPVVWNSLGGTASSSDMQISNGVFEVPPTTDACGGFKDEINDALMGNQNSISMTLDGNFSPPAQDDRLFFDGFELQP